MTLAILGLLSGCEGNLNQYPYIPHTGDADVPDDEWPADDEPDGGPVDDDGGYPDGEDPGDAGGGDSEPEPEDDPPTRPVDPEDEEDPPDDEPDPPPVEELSSAGGPCDCDDDCEPTGGYTPMCIHGICGVRSSDDSCMAGSTSSCPPGHRCWSGTGRGVCYPDYVPGSCAGTQDGDGSCVTDGTRDCYAVCGTLCDLSGDPPGDVEPPDDPPDDPVDPPDDPPDGPCEYPRGPYSFREGSTVAPMSWSSAVPGAADSGTADFEDWHCDPEVHSIFVEVVATWCTACPTRMSEIARSRDHWVRNGVRWLFIVSDASSASMASDYVDRYGIDFGFRTNDRDNSEGSGTIADSSIFSSIPWTGIIRASDMNFYRAEGYSWIDLESVATELAR